MAESPPPQIVQLRGILSDMWERWCDDLRPTSQQILVGIELCDRLAEQYPELTLGADGTPYEVP